MKTLSALFIQTPAEEITAVNVEASLHRPNPISLMPLFPLPEPPHNK
jgi:hypothetical protein